MQGRDPVMPGAVKRAMSDSGAVARVIVGTGGRRVAAEILARAKRGYGPEPAEYWDIRISGGAGARVRRALGTCGRAYRLAAAFDAVREYIEARGFAWRTYNIEVRDRRGALVWSGSAVDIGAMGAEMEDSQEERAALIGWDRGFPNVDHGTAADRLRAEVDAGLRCADCLERTPCCRDAAMQALGPSMSEGGRP